MLLFESIATVRQQVREWRAAGQRIAFVPTMGNLHQGHLALVDHARTHADRVIVSIYINPLQFNDAADLQCYPVTLDADRQALAVAHADALLLPRAGDIYPYGVEQSVQVVVPGLSEMLEGACRPGHFTGVATVVAKLFSIVQPDIAVFGEKDLQQLLLIRRLVDDMLIPIEVLSAPTVREPDGLAMSSRNSFLTVTERHHAMLLYQILHDVRAKWRACTGHIDGRLLENQAIEQLERQGWRPEYISIRHGADLAEVEPGAVQEGLDYYVVAAAWLGDTRLIDNIRL